MNISKVYAVIFSPTDTTKSVISTMLSKIPVPNTIIDITCKELSNNCFESEDIVIFGVPVYGGRVPDIAIEKIKNMKSNKTPAIIVATYGNRDYDDALLELKTNVEDRGFVVVAAAVFITEHSIMHSVAHGRPDEEDNIKICNFAVDAIKKIQNSDNIENSAINVPGNFPYKEYGGVPFKPKTTDSCKKCGECIDNCPVDAISNEFETCDDLCIACQRCIKVCPSNARKLNEKILSEVEKSFAEKFSERREVEIFI